MLYIAKPQVPALFMRAHRTTEVHDLLADLRTCSKTRNLEKGRLIHAGAVDCGHDSNIYVATALINMYSKCGSMMDARHVFDSISHPDGVSWNALILGYATNGQGFTSLELFNRMRAEGPAPEAATFAAALKACISLAVKAEASEWVKCRERGEVIHNLAVEEGCNSHIYVLNNLIVLYAKCNHMVDGRRVFDSIKDPDVVTWNALILGYADCGEGLTALIIFTEMRTKGPAPDRITFMACLKACTAHGRTECKRLIQAMHSLAVENGCVSHVFLQNTLIDAYSKCDSMLEARGVFDAMKHPDVVSWNALILGYVENGQDITALEFFTWMKAEGPAPDYITFFGALKASSCLAEAGDSACRGIGEVIYNLATENGCNSHIYVQTSLLDMYAKCGRMADAAQLFETLKHPTLVSWNALILGYAENGQGITALELFVRMSTRGPAPDSVTFVGALKACISVKGGSECCKVVHNVAAEKGCDSDIYVKNTLIDSYAKCGSILDARQEFDSLQHPTAVSWSVLISGYAENEQALTALELFTRMRIEGPAPDSSTFVAALKACTALGERHGSSTVDRGKALHSLLVLNGCSSHIYVQNTLVDMYAKCGNMTDAREVFVFMKTPDIVSWNALILGYAENDQGDTALDMFVRMRTEGPAPNPITYAVVLKACICLGALEFGRTIHSEIVSGNNLNMVLVTCLVDFYAKCGSLAEAQSVFDKHAEVRNIITWNALLAGFGNCGQHEVVFKLFEKMQDAGIQPDGVTFLCILRCCSHAGLVGKGKECFDTMSTIYGIIPTVEHYNCMVDIFGRANRLDDAINLLERMPSSPNDVTWTTLLGACRKWKNVEIGRLAFQSLNR